MSGLCGTCRHWQERTDWRSAVSAESYVHFYPDDETWERRDQLAEEADVLYRECGAVRHGAGDLADNRSLPLALTKDGSDYHSVLYTRAEFGCVLHEPAGEPA